MEAFLADGEQQKAISSQQTAGRGSGQRTADSSQRAGAAVSEQLTAVSERSSQPYSSDC
jgi:biotin-(acetyl-CoA carboxylase) ligase